MLYKPDSFPYIKNTKSNIFYYGLSFIFHSCYLSKSQLFTPLHLYIPFHSFCNFLLKVFFSSFTSFPLHDTSLLSIYFPFFFFLPTFFKILNLSWCTSSFHFDPSSKFSNSFLLMNYLRLSGRKLK